APRFQFMNIAIGEAGERSFYYVAEAATDEYNDLPPWYNQIGGFSREHIVRQSRIIGRDLEKYIVKAIVQSKLLGEALEDVERVDMILMDTEGYDFKILQQVEFARWRPEIIIYEHINLSAGDQEAARRLLSDNGYSLTLDTPNTVAVR